MFARGIHIATISFVIWLLSGPKESDALTYCPPGWFEYNWACHSFNPKPLTYDDAESACNALLPGAHLSAPRDTGENNFLTTLRTTSTLATWVGAKYGSAAYVTPAGAPYDYTLPWAASNPVNTAGNCASMQSGVGSWSWESSACTNNMTSFCMFYTHMPSINPEMFIPFTRLYGGHDWSGLRNAAYLFQDMNPRNATLTTGPTGTPESAVELPSGVDSSYISLYSQSSAGGINYQNKSFYFMFHVYMTDSVGPILQYSLNTTHYGFNIWSNGNGTISIDMSPWTFWGPVSVKESMHLVPSGCLTTDAWNWLTVNYDYTNGNLFVWKGTGSATPCLQVAVGQIPLEMSNGFNLGMRESSPSNVYWSGKIGCFISGEAAPLTPFQIGEAHQWCNQASLEQIIDKPIARRQGIAFAEEAIMVGIWPLTNFYRQREASGRAFAGAISNHTYAFGPTGLVNTSLVFDGLTTQMLTSNIAQQYSLGASMSILRKSFTISAFVNVAPNPKKYMGLWAFHSHLVPMPLNETAVLIEDGKHIRVVLQKPGGSIQLADEKFDDCLQIGTWHYVSIVYDYPNGKLRVIVDDNQCGSDANIGQEDIEGQGGIYLGMALGYHFMNLEPKADTWKTLRGKLSCFTFHMDALTVAKIATVRTTCEQVLATGRVFDGYIYKPQHLRLFLPLGRNYGLQDLSGRNLHGATRGRLGTGTGPLGHPYSATKFYGESNGGIDIQTTVREAPYSIGTNDSVTYMAYVYAYPGRDGNLPSAAAFLQFLFEHWDNTPSGGGGCGFHVAFANTNGIYFNPCWRCVAASMKATTVTHNLPTMGWNWLVVRFSRSLRRLYISLNDVAIYDQPFGWHMTNTYSSMTIGHRFDNGGLRFTGKMACFMMYDTDLYFNEIQFAKDMCHATILNSYGPAVSPSTCLHTSTGGWEYSGTVSWTATNKRCRPWAEQNVYLDNAMFPEGDRGLARSYCRNPDPNVSTRNRPFCYVGNSTLNVPLFENCNIPTCTNARNWPLHKPEHVVAYWPMGRIFAGSDISGHNAHAGMGADTQWGIGPSGIANTATYFRPTTSGHYWVQHGDGFNAAALLDLGRKSTHLPNGYSYVIMAKYTTAFTGLGAIWSWEANNGEGGNSGIYMQFASGGFMRTTVVDYNRLSSSPVQSCGGLVDGAWYHFTLVYNRARSEINVYKDTELCTSWNYAASAAWFRDGLSTASGSFKFGRQAAQSGSSVNLACAGIYLIPLLPNDIAVIRQKCFDLHAGLHTEYTLEPVKPSALWPMSAQTGGLNMRGPNHARFAMAEPTVSPFGVAQGALAFSGNNHQYFYAFQEYEKNLDFCSASRSFTMATYAFIQSIGTLMSFHTSVNAYDDFLTAGRGNTLSVGSTQTDVTFRYADESANVFNPIKASVLPTVGWAHVAVSYDYPSDNFIMFVNGLMVYNQVGARGYRCQTSGSVSMARSAAFPITQSLSAQPFQGSLHCAQIFSQGLQTESSISRTQKYCGHPDFIGCYPSMVGGSNDFKFNPGSWRSEAVTVTSCRELCGISNFQYAAIRNGNICMCSNTYGSDGPEASEKCTVQCPGSSFQGWCGGPNHFSVYRSNIARSTAAPAIKSVDYANCLPGWTLRGGFCYRIFTSRKTFELALSYCDSFGASLAVIENNDENNFIAEIAPSNLLSSDFVCFGVNGTVALQGRGSNIDRSTQFYANWAAGQPSTPSQWGCLSLNTKTWSGQSPNADMNFVCKKEAGPYFDFVAATKCAPGWRRFNGQCYIFQQQQLPFTFARQACQNYEPKASLVKITNPTQWEFILNITDLQRPFWLGMEYSRDDGKFFWSADGSIVNQTDFVYWAGDERFRPETERTCVYSDTRTQFRWRYAECDGSRAFAYACYYDLPGGTVGTIGLASGRILDAQLVAYGVSSSATPASYARLGYDASWCIETTDVPNAYLIIDLRDTYKLQEMWFAGNPSDNTAWMEEATLEWSTDGGVSWNFYNFTTAEHWTGAAWTTLGPHATETNFIPLNTDVNTNKHRFAYVIEANKLRLTPTKYNTKPCLQLEFYGELANPSQQIRTLDLAFRPIRIEVTRAAGTLVRYNATVFFNNPRIRAAQIGFTERVTGFDYIYRPRTFGWQRVVLSGIDAEGKTHELGWETETGLRARRFELNMCPVAVLYGTYAACEVRIVGGTEFDVTTDYGFEKFGPTYMQSQRVEVGLTNPPTSTAVITSDTVGFVYLLINQAVKLNATMMAVEAVVTQVGWITIQIYQPHCPFSDTFFCPISHSCLNRSSANNNCAKQKPFDSYTCQGGFGKGPYATCSQQNSDNMQIRNGFFTSSSPRIDYKLIREFRKYFQATGVQVVYFDESEQMELTLGMVLGYVRSAADSGRVLVYQTSIREYQFSESTNGYSTTVGAVTTRNMGFVISRTVPLSSTVTHMIKLITVSSVGLSFGRKWGTVPAGIHNIKITAQDRIYPDNVLQFMYDLEVQYRCEGFKPVFEPISDAAQFVPFTIPEHNGTKCYYLLDFGDGSKPVSFDYHSRNKTYFHVYRLYGEYNVSLTVWNLVDKNSISVPITIVFPIEKISMYMANPPVTEFGHFSTAVITFAQASNSYTVVDLDVNGTSGALATRSFSPCPSGWVSGLTDAAATDACYRFFHNVKLTYERAEYYCASLGASLISGTSDTEWDLVKKVMSASGGPTDEGPWTSYTQTKDAFQFWVSQDDKRALVPPFWQETSGVFPKPGGGTCAYYDFASRRFQNDNCTLNRPTLCKREVSINSYCGPGSGWTYDPETNRCFKVFTPLGPFKDAVVACRRLGGTLAVPESEMTHKLLFNLVKKTKSDMSYYIGIWRPDGTQWKLYDGWVGFPPTFLPTWEDGTAEGTTTMPVAFQGENCIALVGSTGRYKIVACADMDGYVCEKSVYGTKPTRYAVRTASRRYIYSTAPQWSCGLGWTLRNESGYCFKMFKASQKTWNAAEADCVSRGAHLASINTAEDQTYFTNNFVDGAGVDVWLGLAEVSTANNWLWSDGTDPTGGNKPWAAGMPVTGLGYVYYMANTQFWYEGSGAETKAYVCAKPAYPGIKTFAGSCPNGYLEFEGRCFKYVSTAQTQSQASASCQTEGGGLASIRSDADRTFIRGILPMSANEAYVGLAYTSGEWQWTKDVRSLAHPLVHDNLWAPGNGGAVTSPSCSIMKRSEKFFLVNQDCAVAKPYICEQPAAICPPSWTIWAGSCYRAFDAELKLQPSNDDTYDTAPVACMIEDSLPISPVNQQELNFAVSLAGSGKTFGFGYRRKQSSMGFSDLWGRRSFFAGQAGEPDSGHVYAYWTGSAVAYTSEMWTQRSVCQSPTKLNPDFCIRECLNLKDFDCKTVQYDGSKCEMTSIDPSENWFGLRESYTKIDLYHMRTDLCSGDQLKSASLLQRASVEGDETTGWNVLLDGVKKGYRPIDENDTLTVQFDNTIWFNGLTLAKHMDNDEYITKFKIYFTFDRSAWYFYQYPPGVDVTFDGNTPDEPVVQVTLPKPVLVKAITIVPLTWNNHPSFRMRLAGCSASMFIDYAETQYRSTTNSEKKFYMAAKAYSIRNNATTDPMPINVETRVLTVTLPQPPALAHGSYATLPFTYTESGPYSFPLANFSFNGLPSANVTVLPVFKKGSAIIAPEQYGAVGWYWANLTLDNLLSDPLHTETVLWVDYPVRNLRITTNATKTHGALQNQTIAVYITMENCTRCNLSVSYGAIDAMPQVYYANYYDFVLENTALIDIPLVAYPSLGGFYITAYANNYLPVVKTFTYDIYVQLEPLETTFNYTATTPNLIPYQDKAKVYFGYIFTGYVFYWPSNASMFLDFADETNLTQPFDNTLMPPFRIKQSVRNLVMGNVSHAYGKYGTYTVYMEVFNRVGNINSTVTFDCDEEIYGLKITPLKRYIAPGGTVAFNVTWLWGTRFQWQVQIPNPDNTTEWTNVFDWNVTTFSWTFYQVGAYLPLINGSNIVMEYPPFQMDPCCPVIVQHPVTATGFKLTANPPAGKLLFRNAEDEIGYSNAMFVLWVNTQLTFPSDPYFIIYYGDQVQSVNTSLACDPELSKNVDGPYVACRRFPYTYNNATYYEPEIFIANMASEYTFKTQYTVYVAVTNLRLGVRFTENETHPDWVFGYPRIDPKEGPKPYSQAFFPTGKPLRVTAQAKLGDGLRYCFFTDVEGNITDCSGEWTATPNWVIRTFDYDTPCLSRLEACGLTLIVVASNPVDTATASITVYLQKPAENLRIVEYGPGSENQSFPLWLNYDRFPTDGCVEIDYGTDMMVSGFNRRQLFGSEYMCADSYDQEIMKSLKPITAQNIADKVASITTQFYRRGQYWVSAKVRNFVSYIDSVSHPKELKRYIKVTRGPCSYPKTYIDAPTQHFKRDELLLSAGILMNCTSSRFIGMNWTIKYRPTATDKWEDITLKWLKPLEARQKFYGVFNMTSPLDKSLTFPATSLSYGFYNFSIWAAMLEEEEIENTISHVMEVIKSDLVVGFTPPGGRRDLVFREKIRANAWTRSYDPDIGGLESSKEGMKVYYYCKRDCDGPWPTFTSFEQVQVFIKDPWAYNKTYPEFQWGKCLTDDANLKTEMYEAPGCFVSAYHMRRSSDPNTQWGFPSINPGNFTRTIPKVFCGENATTDCEILLSSINEDNTLRIDSSYQFENQTYNLLAIVTKDNRWSIGRQSYRLERGSAPQALIRVVTNCAHPHKDVYKFNPTSRASFHGLITDRILGRMYFFDWRLIEVPPKKRIDEMMEFIEDAVSNNSWPFDNWVNLTSTGRIYDDLSMNVGLMGENDYEKYWIVYVGVVRAGNPRVGISTLPFYVNRPPDGTNVTCKSNVVTGTAMFTPFTFECTGFKSPHVLSKFAFSMQACKWCPQVVLTPTISTPSIKTGLKLPPGFPEEDYMVTIFVDAYDPFDSMVRVQFKVRVEPKVTLNDVIELAETYKKSVLLMTTEDVCQNMYSFSSIMNEVYLEPIYAFNTTAYKLMNAAQQKVEDQKVADDTARYNKELNKMREIRYNITEWMLKAMTAKNVRNDANAVRTCCSAVAYANSKPDQAAEARMGVGTLALLKTLAANLKNVAESPTRDADRLDETTSACVSAAGNAADAFEYNQDEIRKRDAEKRRLEIEKNGGESSKEESEKEDKSKETSDWSSDADPITKRRKRSTSDIDDFFGQMLEAISRTEQMDDLLNSMHEMVLGAKVLQEATSSISGPGVAANLQKRFVGDLNNAVIPSGGDNDCGSFLIGDASVMFEAADPFRGTVEMSADALPPSERLKWVDLKLKASQQTGNSYKFDSSADDLNSNVHGLKFLNSSGGEVIVKDLPFEIEIMIESKNPALPDETQLKSLTPPAPRGLKSMVLNVTAFSAMFLTFERWNLPNVCSNNTFNREDLALNLTCTSNVSTLLFDHTNYTVPSLNITDEEVIFFVYVKANDTPSVENFDLGCTLPRMAFEYEYMAATGQPWLDEPTATNSSTLHVNGSTIAFNWTNTAATVKPVTTAAPTTTVAPTTTTPAPTTTAADLMNAPKCTSTNIYNVTCCNGTLDVDGFCLGHFVVPTTPAPKVIPVTPRTAKNCSRPTVPNPNTCFFDHRIVNVTKESKLFKIGVRAVPLSLVRAFLKEWAATTDQPITPQNALNASREKLDSAGVRVGYRFSTFSSSCKYFDESTKSWSSKGCRVGPLSNPGGNPSMTQCLCNHLTTFSSNFDVPMNTFDPRDSAFTKLDQNPICFVFGLCIFCCFFALLIWARKRDKEDEKKWGTTPLADNDPRDKYAYELTVWTGTRSEAGTSARISFILLGDEGETPVHLLEDDERDVLQRGSIDSFLLLTPRSLGKLVQLRIWHDNSGKHPNWYFSRMMVHDLQRNRQYYFLCDRWLAIDEDDGMVERIIPVAGKKELAGFEHLFFTKSRRKLTDGHIWISVFSRPPLSKFTRCQRLTCCISVLYCTMVANIMFFGIDRDPPGSTRIDLGPISMSLTKIFMSIVSALIVIPVNLVIVQLFRMSKHRPTKQEKKMETLRAKAIKAEEEERKKAIAAGLAAPPQQVNMISVSGDVSTSDTSKMSKRALRKAEKAKKKKKPFKLPWWCIIVAYCLSFATCGVAFWAIVEFGGALGPEKAQEWLVAMIISLFTDILVMQPAKILALALFYALIIKSPTKDEDIEEKAMLKDDEVFMHQMPTEKEMAERKARNDDDKKDYVFLPPDPEELKVAREMRLKEQKMWKIIKEIGFYVMFTYLLMMVAFAQKDDWGMMLQQQMRNVYHEGILSTPPYNASVPAEVKAYNPSKHGHDERFKHIWQAETFFTYLERTLIPSVLDGTWYNGKYDSDNDVFTKDQALYLVGAIRIRQVRIKPDACRIPRNVRGVYTQNCLAPYSIFDEETRNFTVGWELAPYSNKTVNKNGKFITLGDTRGFAYKSEIDDRGLPFSGALATYNGGGYIVELGKKVETAMARVAYLKANKWIDERTRAVFIEFNLYCPNRNLFAISQSIVEFFPGGSVVLFPYFYITKVDPYYGVFSLVLLGFQCLTIAIVIGLFVREIQLAIKYKRQYWQDAWAVLEFLHLMLCIVAGAMFVMRFMMAKFVVGDNYKKSHKTGYTNFNIFVTYDEMVNSFMACVVFIAFMRLIRLLRFNRRLVLMLSTLRHCRSMMLSFFAVFFIAYSAFAQLGYLSFGPKNFGYSTFVTALESLFMMLLGVYDYKGLQDANWFVGPLFFTMYSIFINIFLMNAFVALLMFSYEECRNDATKLGNDYEMMEFIMNKFKVFLGLKPKRATTLSVDKRFAYMDAAMHEDEVDKFTARMDELMTKLDEHLEKTKSQFSGMFDQTYLSRKRREVYITE